MTSSQMLFLVLVFLSVCFPVAIILYARLIAPLKLRRRWRFLWGALTFVLVLIAACGIPATSIIGKNLSLSESLYYSVWGGWPYIVMTFIILLVMVILLRDIIIWIVKLCVCVAHRKKKAAVSENRPENEACFDDDAPEDVSRRHFLIRTKQIVTVGTAAVLSPAAVCEAINHRVVRNVEVALGAVPEALNGFRIVQLSDIHVGNTIKYSQVAEIVAETNALEPDLIVITGDVADGYPDVIGDWLEPMRGFKSKYGVYYVTGNHEHMYDAWAWCEKMKTLGVHVLDNAHEIIDIDGTPLAVAGAIDARGDRRRRWWKSNPEAALAGIAPDIFKLMLVHQPASVDRSLAAGADLVLAGHTHGGQFWPACYIVDIIHKYSRGFYPLENKAVFVSCGTGYWGPPLRIGVPAEIDILTLRHAAGR